MSSEKDPIKIRRCYKQWLPLKQNYIKYQILKCMSFHSRAIYNSCIYFQRQMYLLRKQLIEYYINHFNNFYKKFSLSDNKKPTTLVVGVVMH